MNDLDHFESELLTELRVVVGERLRQPSRARSVKRWSSVTAAAVAVAGGLVIANTGAAAYAVDGQPDGDVTVRINKLEDAQGLEQALGDAGVHARVSYRGSELSGDSESARAAAFDPKVMPDDERSFGMSDCDASALPAVQRDGDSFDITIAKMLVDSQAPLTVYVAGTDVANADLLVAIGGKSSGCAVFAANGHIGTTFAWGPN